MAITDQYKTAFWTETGTYCYKMMSFGLKNVGSTYQRLMDREFKGQIGRNLEVYMDDLVFKSSEEPSLLKDIEETFNTLRGIRMKLNPGKCSFWIDEGKFLGIIVTSVNMPAFHHQIGTNAEWAYCGVEQVHGKPRR